MAASFSNQLRQAIQAADQSRRQIGQATNIDPATLSRFMQGKGGLSMDGLDRLVAHLGLRLSPKASRK